jgi:hypothetical protein
MMVKPKELPTGIRLSKLHLPGYTIIIQGKTYKDKLNNETAILHYN